MLNIIVRIAAGAVFGMAVGGAVVGTQKAYKKYKVRRDVKKHAEKATSAKPTPAPLEPNLNRFTLAYASAVDVPYDLAWANTTGYLDNAVHFYPSKDADIPGRLFRSLDDKGRRILLIPISKKAGSLVIFERYFVENTDQKITYAYNAKREIEKMICDRLGNFHGSDEHLIELIGDVRAGGAENGIRDVYLSRHANA